VEEPEKGIGDNGVRLSAVMVTGRQKIEGSEVKRLKASWSSEETGWGIVVSLSVNGGDIVLEIDEMKGN
jgi:hypothetical protein